MFRRIYAMSLPRSKALAHADAYSESLIEHVIKVIVYGNIRSDFVDHWIGEMSRWLYEAGKITVKPDGRKLRAKDYENTIFGWMGDQLNDYSNALSKFQHENKQGKFSYEDKEPYPYVEPSVELASKLMTVCLNLINVAIPMLTSSATYSIGDYNKVLKDILK